jgi:hypothetical protein
MNEHMKVLMVPVPEKFNTFNTFNTFDHVASDHLHPSIVSAAESEPQAIPLPKFTTRTAFPAPNQAERRLRAPLSRRAGPGTREAGGGWG